MTRPVALLPVSSLPLHRLGETFCRGHGATTPQGTALAGYANKTRGMSKDVSLQALCLHQPLGVEDQQGEPTLVTSTYLRPVASFPLGAQEVAASLHRQLLLLTALAVVQDIVVGVHAHGSPPPRAPAAALGALGRRNTE